MQAVDTFVTSRLLGPSVRKRTSIMRVSTKGLAILAVLLLPGTVFAQSVLTGTGRDPSGAALPAARAVGALLNATPGLTVDNNGPALSPTMTFFNAHSSAANSTGVAGEGRMTVNGMTIAAARSGGVSSYVYDTPNSQEVAITVGGGLGESDIGGPVMNLVPKSGGNTFAGTAFFNEAGSWSRGTNLTGDLRAIGLAQAPGIIRSYAPNDQ